MDPLFFEKMRSIERCEQKLNDWLNSLYKHVIDFPEHATWADQWILRASQELEELGQIRAKLLRISGNPES
jgi:hypothetical protein